MLNLRYFLDARFGVASGVITLTFFAMFGFFFLLTQYFQLVLGYGPLEAGVKQLPFAAVMIISAPQSPRCRRQVRHEPGGRVWSARRLGGHVPVHDRSHRHLVLGAATGLDDDGRWHGDGHPVDDRLDHVGRAARQGRRRVGSERHDPRVRWRARRRGAGQPGGVPVRLAAGPGARPAPRLVRAAKPTRAWPVPCRQPERSVAAAGHVQQRSHARRTSRACMWPR